MKFGYDILKSISLIGLLKRNKIQYNTIQFITSDNSKSYGVLFYFEWSIFIVIPNLTTQKIALKITDIGTIGILLGKSISCKNIRELIKELKKYLTL